MPTVGTLNIALKMSTDAVTGGAAKAASAISKMADSIKSSFVKMSMSLTPVVDVGQLVGSITAIATAQSKFIDDTGKLADRLNITTEAFVGMAHAADLAGVGTDEFGGMLEKLQKNLGKMNEDEGKTQEIVEGLGISLKDLKRQGIDRTFLDITDAIEKTKDPLKRSELLISLFGKSGQKLANTMMAGKQSIREAMEEAQKLGMTFSRMDAAKVEAANDAFTRMKGAIAGIGNTLTIGLAPFFEVAFNKARDFIATSGQDIAKQFVSSAVSFVDGIQKAYEVVLRIGVKISDSVTEMWQLVHAVAALTGNPTIEKMAASNALASTRAGNVLHGQAEQAAAAPRWSAEIVNTANEAAAKVAAGLQVGMVDKVKMKFGQMKDDIVGSFKGIQGQLDPVWKKMQDNWQKRIDAGKATKEAVKTPLEKWSEQKKELDKQLKEKVINQKDYNRAMLLNNQTLDTANSGFGPSPGASGAEFGTSNAQSIIAGSKMNFSSSNNTPKTLQDSLKEHKKANALLDKQAAAAAAQAAALKDIAVVNF